MFTIFTSELKNKLVEFNLLEEGNQLVECLIEHKKRYIKKLVPQLNRPDRLLGQNGLHYIQLELFRSKTLIEGCITSINGNNGLSAMLCARGHLEVTGSLGFFYKKLKNFYDQVITYETLDNSLTRLTLGARDEELDRAPDPINVMSFIDAIDDYFKKNGDTNVPMFRESYDFLSEFCHPNFYGISIGAEVNKIGVVRYTWDLTLTGKDLGFLYHLIMSSEVFLNFYDAIYDLLCKNEELPTIVKE